MAVKINVCVGSSCGGKGGTSLVRDIEEICQGRAIVDPGQCLGKCANGPNVEVVAGSNKEVSTKVNSYKKAVELVKNGVEDIEIRSITRNVGKVKWTTRRDESGAVRQQKIEECIALVGGEEKAKSKEPLIMSELFVLRSKEMLKVRKYPEALQDAEEALKLQAEWPQALLAYAAALEAVGRNADAVAAIEQALKINRGIGAEKSSIIRGKARLDRKVAEGGPIGAGAAGVVPAAAPPAKPAAAATKSAEGDGSPSPPEAAAKPKAKKKAAPKDAAPAADVGVEKKGGTKSQGEKKDAAAKAPSKEGKPGRQSKMVGKDGKEAPRTSTKTKSDAQQDVARAPPPAMHAGIGATEAKKYPTQAATEAEVDLGDMPHQEWRIDTVKHINHDCITIVFSCGKTSALASYAAVGDVWHIDLLAEIGDGEIVRAYTPVSSQDDYYRGSLELMVKVYPDGKMTQHLAKLVPGDIILVSAPLSTLVPQDYAEGMTLIAGGTAVTFALQVCNAVLRLSAPGATAASPVHAFLCNHTDADALYQERFEKLQATYPSLRVIHCLSQGSHPEIKSGRAEWHNGRIGSKILGTAEARLKSVVSGPPSMCNTALSLLTQLGRSRESIEVVDELPEAEAATEALETRVEYPIKAWCTVGPNGKPCGGGAEGPSCSGVVHLEQVNVDTCRISYEIKGLAPGKHGFHIHEKSDFSNGCLSAGPHYNPHGKVHGGPEDVERHVGDLGNVEPGEDGVARGEITDSLIKLHGQFSVMGRSFMVHADPDDLGRGDHSDPGTNCKTSQTTGNAGARIACGEINEGEYVPPKAPMQYSPMQYTPMQYVAPSAPTTPRGEPDVATPAVVALAGHMTQPARAAAADLVSPSQPMSWLGCGLLGACRPRRRAPSPDCEGDGAMVIVDE